MKKALTILAICLSTSLFVQAQTVDTLICDALDRDTTSFENLPWFGKNIYLKNFLDSIGYPAAGTTNRIVTQDVVKFHVPIKFWVYRSSSGTGGPTLVDLQGYIDDLNRSYNGENSTWIGFYMRCQIGFIDDDSHINVESNLEAINLLRDNKESGCINIHVTNNISGGTFGVQYRARFFGIDGIFLSSETYTNGDLASTIAHEVGHYFELDHTHQYFDKGKCRREAIDRNRNWSGFLPCFPSLSFISGTKVCESTGDGLSDTPADPELNANNSCTYNAGGNYSGKTDSWNDHYETPPVGSLMPDTRNLMNYNRNRACRVVFSRLQIAVMLHSIIRGKSSVNKIAWEDTRAIYDDFEMDDLPVAARQINLNQVQERNFHQQYLGSGNWSQCDVDWVSFVAPCNINLFLLTTELPAYSNLKANTRLTLFAANGTTQLAQNDNISATNLFSSINWNFIAGQIYLIRVENMTPLYTGYYQLRFSGSNATYGINGTSTVCTQSLFNVTNLPVGSTVLWGPSPSPLISIATNAQQQATVSKIASGDLILTASVQTAACGTTLSTLISRPIRVGGYSSGDYPISGPTSGCKNTTLYFSTLALPGATNYDWFWPTGWTNASGQGTRNFSIRTNSTSGQVGVRVASVCDAGGSPSIRFVQVNTGCGASFIISPNPSEGEVNIMPNEADNNFTKAAKRTTTKIYQIILTDQSGITRRRYSYTAGILTAKINVADLRRGIYTIRIYDGSAWATQKLIKQ